MLMMFCMKITEVKIEIIKPSNGLIGFASVVIDNSIYLGSIAVYKKLNAEGYRILYPKKGAFDIFHPITKEASNLIEEAIFNKLEDVMSKVYDRYDSYENSVQ
jgi:DNA-binding cell septation regulator SpoVG